MAETVVDLLLDLARQNKTMVCIIHQPSSQIYEKFDTYVLQFNYPLFHGGLLKSLK